MSCRRLHSQASRFHGWERMNNLIFCFEISSSLTLEFNLLRAVKPLTFLSSQLRLQQPDCLQITHSALLRPNCCYQLRSEIRPISASFRELQFAVPLLIRCCSSGRLSSVRMDAEEGRRKENEEVKESPEKDAVKGEMDEGKEKEEKKSTEEARLKKEQEMEEKIGPPPEKPLPGDCCGQGCDVCVWDTYWEELDEYKKLRKAAEESG